MKKQQTKIDDEEKRERNGFLMQINQNKTLSLLLSLSLCFISSFFFILFLMPSLIQSEGYNFLSLSINSSFHRFSSCSFIFIYSFQSFLCIEFLLSFYLLNF